MARTPRQVPLFKYRVSTPFGDFQAVSQHERNFIVVYLPADRERDGREAFAAGWATTPERAEEIATVIRAKGEVNVLVVPVNERRPWIRRKRSEPEE